MKKLLLLPTLLLAINLGAATTEQSTESQNDTQIAEQTEIAQTKTDKQTPSFWVRHADKLKKGSYVADGVLTLATIVFFTDAYFNNPAAFTHKTIFPLLTTIGTGCSNTANNERIISKYSICLLAISFTLKFFIDPATRYAMSKKIAHIEEQLKETQDQQEKVATEQA